jgi:hypothetical protein
MAYRFDPTALYRRTFVNVAPGGRLMIFGRPSFLYAGAPTPEEFFRKFGFAEVHTIDVSPYQGASHIFDLNEPEPPAELVGKYRYVLSGGTLEHVFNVAHAVRTAVALLEPGGELSFSAPCNNWVDHGFYQISPTFAFDYFTENGLEFTVSTASLQDPRTHDRLTIPLYPGESGILAFHDKRVSYSAHVIRVPGSTYDKVPKQGVYQSMHDGAERRFRFMSFPPTEMIRSEVRPVPLTVFPLKPVKMQQAPGGYRHPFHSPNHLASLPGRLFRSKGIVYEDEEPLPWVVSDPAMIGERPGSFMHFRGVVYFSTGDGSDPRENDRAYSIRFPDHPLLNQTQPRILSATSGGEGPVSAAP